MRGRDPVRWARAEDPQEVPAGRLHDLLTCYFLGDRSLRTFGAFVFPDLSGTVVVHDRYRTTCATRRTAISPAKRAENGGDVFGSDALPETERLNGKTAWQQTGSRVQASGTVCREIRAIW